MTAADDEQARRAERSRAVALFRYSLIREAADPGLTTRQRGRLVRELAARAHAGPFGEPVRCVAAQPGPVDPGLAGRRVRRAGPAGPPGHPAHPGRGARPGRGAETGEPGPHRRAGRPDPARQRRVVARRSGPCSATSSRLELLTRPDGSPPPVFGRFEAARPNELWTGDALHGPVIGGRKTYLFAFIDDHSRLITGHRFGHAEDTVRLAAALRPALASHGVPDRIYVDNGSAFVDAWLLRACAVLGIKLTHCTPGRPQGRGKIERLFLTVREQFLVEITGDPGEAGRRHVTSIAELNRLFTAWAGTVYHRRGALRDRAGPAAAVGGRLGRDRAAAARTRPAARGVLVERAPHRPQDRDRVAARQHLPGRPLPGRPQGRAGLRPVRPGQHRGALARQTRPGRRSRTSSAATPTPRPAPSSPPRPPRDRHRLHRADRRRPRRPPRRRRHQLRRPQRPALARQTLPSCPAR